MKILCLSDQIDPLIYTDTVKQRYGDVDFILSAGDLPMEYLNYIAGILEKPLFFVLGEHHAENGDANLDTKIYYRNGLMIAGLGGSLKRYNIKILKLLPALVFNRIFRGRFPDILLTHAPPRGIHDKEGKHQLGFRAFLWFMRIFEPRYLVHGHIHLYDTQEHRETKYHKTLVINVYGHYLIDTEKKYA